MPRAEIGVIFRPQCPPERLPEVADAAEAAGIDQLWLWEDCFLHGGLATAAVALARTSGLRVGLGLVPVPLRNPALAAMEIATLSRVFPGRLLPALGHGVQEWMGQVGARVGSPLTLLAEYADAVRGLLAGRTLTTAGRYVALDAVALDWPPTAPQPVLVGGRGPKTLRLAGEHGDGVLLDSGLSPQQVRDALATVEQGRTGGDDAFRRIGYVHAPEPAALRDTVASYVDAGLDAVVIVPPEADPDPVPWIEALA